MARAHAALAPQPSGGRGAVLLTLALLLAPPCLAPPAAGQASGQVPTEAAANVRPGKWNNRPPPGWIVVETPHYQVQSRLPKDTTRALAEHLESMLELYREFLPTRRSLDTFVLKLFKDRREFLAYTGENDRTGPVGLFDADNAELVAYDTGIILGKRSIPAQIGLALGVADRFTMGERQGLYPLFEAITDAYIMDTARILSHEGWHQYFRAYTVSVVDMPAWLDEGVGDYFFTATWDRSRDGRHGYQLGELNEFRLRDLERAVSEAKTVSFHEMLGYGQDQYYADATAFYAQGWSMVQFLMHHSSLAGRKLVPTLIADFKDSKNFEVSTARVFEGIDMEALDREWAAWVANLDVDDPMEDLARDWAGKLKSRDLLAEKGWISAYLWYVAHPVIEPARTLPPTTGPPPTGPEDGAGD